MGNRRIHYDAYMKFREEYDALPETERKPFGQRFCATYGMHDFRLVAEADYQRCVEIVEEEFVDFESMWSAQQK